MISISKGDFYCIFKLTYICISMSWFRINFYFYSFYIFSIFLASVIVKSHPFVLAIYWEDWITWHTWFTVVALRGNQIITYYISRDCRLLNDCQWCAIYFQPFVKDYASLAAPLYDMSADKFNWDKKTWAVDYLDCFKKFKKALNDSQKLAFPDFECSSNLRTLSWP